ncbi:unnamed protein product [Symbiodinium sp. CCMP2592]|nr:unnamed protein product [Symbiodinium sp. CCMP2592]
MRHEGREAGTQRCVTKRTLTVMRVRTCFLTTARRWPPGTLGLGCRKQAPATMMSFMDRCPTTNGEPSGGTQPQACLSSPGDGPPYRQILPNWLPAASPRRKFTAPSAKPTM